MFLAATKRIAHRAVRAGQTGRLLSPYSLRWMSSYPPHEVVGMPSLSPTMEAGAIASWNKDEGDAFGPGDVLCSVETDKATVDFEAQDDGIVAKILRSAGPDEITCGQPIMITVEDEDDVAAFKDYKLEEAPAEKSEPEAPTPIEPEPAQSPSPAPAPAPSAATDPSGASSGGRVIASPLAHTTAKEMNYDISKIPGTGPGGRIIAADVREYVPPMEQSAASGTDEGVATSSARMDTSSPQPGDGYTDYPVSESAQEVAARLAQSKRNVPHYYLTVDVCMDQVIAMTEKLASSAGDGSPLGTYEFMLKAAAASMKAVPSANASWMDTVVRVYDSVDINVVVGSGDDLYTPVIRDCGNKGLLGINQALSAAMESYEDGAPTADFPSMGTLTVMNLGMYGVKSCAPIIREPQAIALAIGALENRVVPNDDPESEEIYKTSVMMTATVSCDHRVVDGAVGAQWLSAFKSHLEDPTTLLL